MYDYEIIQCARELNIPLDGVYMLDELPKDFKRSIIINLDDSRGPGSHWVCMFKKNKDKVYYDSYGFPPPKEVKNKYPGGMYSTFINQGLTEKDCGERCLRVLRNVFVRRMRGIEAIMDG